MPTMNIDRVLVPTDSDRASDGGVERGLEFAADNDAEVTVLEVVEDSAVAGSIYGEPPPAADVRIGKATEHVEAVASRAEDLGVEVDPVVKTGDVRDVVVEFSCRGGFDVVVVEPDAGAKLRDLKPVGSAGEVASLADTIVMSVPARIRSR